MKKMILIPRGVLVAIVASVVVFLAGCSKDNKGESGPFHIKRASSSYGGQSTGSVDYRYDQQMRLISVKNIGAGAGGLNSDSSSFEYGDDGMIKYRLDKDGRRKWQYVRDAAGRLTLVIFYHNSGAEWYYDQYGYFDDRYERKSVQLNNTVTQTEKAYYTADKLNTAKQEFYTGAGQLSSSTTFEYSNIKDPYHQQSEYFGDFVNMHIPTKAVSGASVIEYTVTASRAGYATEIRTSDGSLRNFEFVE